MKLYHSSWLILVVVVVGCIVLTTTTTTTTAFTTKTTPRWNTRMLGETQPSPSLPSLPFGGSRSCSRNGGLFWWRMYSSASDDNNNDDDQKADPDGASLASELFKMAQAKGVAISEDDLLDDDDEDEDDEEELKVPTVTDEDDDDDDDEPEANYPQGAVNAFLGYDQGITDASDALAGNVSLTDDQLYSEVKERVLDTAGGFVQFVKGATDSEDEDEDDDDDDDMVLAGGELGESRMKTKGYTPPTTVPDSELTAGEVVLLILQALVHNDTPTPNRGIEILFGYSSTGSQIKNEIGLTPKEYGEFLKETEYKVLFTHDPNEAMIDKGKYSFNGKKAFFTAKLKTGPSPLDTISANVQLSAEGEGDDACWLVDSLLIRPPSMQRRRR